MFHRERLPTLEAIGQLGAASCSYCLGTDTDAWLATRCDCKYGFRVRQTPGGEATGCPELRSIYGVVNALTDREWIELVQRAGGILT